MDRITPPRPHTDTAPQAESTRPKSNRRPRTGVSRTGIARPDTARPDTSASGITADELPDQQFFPEDDGFDEEEEEYEEEELEDEGVFAFARPQTGAIPKLTGSEYTTSAPPTGATNLTKPPMTADTKYTADSGAGPSDIFNPPTIGNVDSGGRLPELSYDYDNPPPFSGKNNINNSAFAFSVSSQGTHAPSAKLSMFNRLSRRHLGTASSAMTGSTGITATTEATRSRTSFDSEDRSTDAGHKQPRRVRSGAPLIPSTAGSAYSSDGMTSRGFSRGSYGMTEMTGDMTIPDGKVTWGDGSGHMKDISEQGEDIMVSSSDGAEEDSPYPEVRASVSNMDDVDMPCKSMLRTRLTVALTFRAWFLGMLFAVLGAGINTFFHFRNPSPRISPLIVQ
jgi:hypothetical protein